MQVHKPKKRQGRRGGGSVRVPSSAGAGSESGLELESRVLLSGRGTAAEHAKAAVTRVTHVTRVTPATRAETRRTTPAEEITTQYNNFANDFAGIVQDYVTSINEQSTGSVSVSATVQQAYTSGGSSIVVNNASSFFPNGSTTPVTAQATQGSFVVGSFYLTGYSGNTLYVSPSLSTPSDLSVGAVLTATLTTTSQSSSAGILPSYIINRSEAMAIDLVQYFNSLPLRLPWLNVPPHTPNNRGAIQTYVYDAIVGSSPTSLQNSLLAIPLPTTGGSDLKIYNATVAYAIQQSLSQTLNGVSEVYAGTLKVAAAIPNNRYGASASGTVPSYITASP